MIPVEAFSSCSDPKYMFSRGVLLSNVFIGRDTPIYVNGGVPPYTWYITGTEFDLDQTTTTDQYNIVRSNNDTVVGESTEEITVTDSCGSEISFTVQCCSRYTCCEELADPLSTDEVISEFPGDYLTVNCYGGCSPFTWISNDPSLMNFETKYTYSRHNRLIAAANVTFSDLIGASLKIIDSCGTMVDAFIGYPYTLLCAGGGNELGNGNIDQSYFKMNVQTDKQFLTWDLYYNTLIAVDEDGSLNGWGLNDFGQLGLGDTVNRSIPTIINDEHNWRYVAVGGNFSLCIRVDGSLWTCGRNNAGQLGTGDNVTYDTFQYISLGWSKIAGGRYHSIGIRAGHLYAWGSGYNYATGLGTTSSINVPTSTGKFNIDFITCGDYSSAYITDGVLFVAGYNESGILNVGNTSPTNYSTYIQISLPFLISKVFIGDLFTLVLTEDGDIYGWGRDNYGILGYYDSAIHSLTQIGIGTTWTDINIGYKCACAIDDIGRLYTWGLNTKDQLGLGLYAGLKTVPTLVDIYYDFNGIQRTGLRASALAMGNGASIIGV